MQLETFEHSHTLTGTDARQQRRAALQRFADRYDYERLCRRLRLAYVTISRLQRVVVERDTTLAEERTLREMVEAENAELRAALRALGWPTTEAAPKA
jgi:hypothetical protein